MFVVQTVLHIILRFTNSLTSDNNSLKGTKKALVLSAPVERLPLSGVIVLNS